MSAQHTPGPWEVRESRASIALFGTQRLARMSVSPDSVRKPQALADARLMSAAPDLLGAAQAAYRLIEALHQAGGTELAPEAIDPLFRAKSLLAAAIAKAEGRQ